MAEEGYFALQLESIAVGLNNTIAPDANWRIDVEIVNGFNVFRWLSTKESKYSTAKFRPEQEADGQDGPLYSYRLDGLALRSDYVELTSEVVSSLCNATVSIKLYTINEGAASAPPPKAAKGQPASVATPAEEVLVELSLPLASLLSSTTNDLTIDRSLENYIAKDLGIKVTAHDSVLPTNSFVNVKLFADNDLSDYALDCRLISWQSAHLTGISPAWTLHYADVIDPKAKVPPTAAELRTKYLESISNLVNTQSKVAEYSLQIGSAESALHWAFGVQPLSLGSIAFERDAANGVPIEEDIRSRTDLWSISWSRSPFIFLHRSQARRLAQQVASDPTAAYLPVTLRKTPTTEAIASEGGEVLTTALVDISPLFATGISTSQLEATGLVGDQMDQATLSIQAGITQPIVPLSQVSQLASKSFPPASLPKMGGGRRVRPAENKDASQELRDEISRIIERIAQEYVSSYPTPVPPTAPPIPDGPGPEKEDERRNFLQHLANCGLFHDLQERLRPAVLAVVQERYGPRGRALGSSPLLRQLDTQDPLNPQSSPLTAEKWEQEGVQAVLSELYVHLCKECNLVLNAMFTRTLIQRRRQQLENPGQPDDEAESVEQRHARLLRQANDSLADNRWTTADAFHLERLAYLEEESKLRQDVALVHESYVQYAHFLLQQASQGITYQRCTRSAWLALLQRARDCLQVAVQAVSSSSSSGEAASEKWAEGTAYPYWSTLLLQACVVMESDQMAAGEEMLLYVLHYQLQSHGKEAQGLDNLATDFTGYESDELCPLHPRIYAILAAMYHVQGKSLQARKALRLADRCYREWDEAETASNLGSPRRSLVLLLSQTTLFLTQHALYSLAQACLSLAQASEQAVQQKAKIRGKIAVSPPLVQHTYKRAIAEAAWGLFPSLSPSEATQMAVDSSLAAARPQDKITGLVVAGQAALRVPDRDIALDNFLKAINFCNESFSVQQAKALGVLPLDAILSAGKLLQQMGRNEEALRILLYASSLYSSASLALQVGINLMRLDRLEEAEAALVEANLLDNRQAEVWAMLAMVNVQHGPHRLHEAEQCLFQTLRLGLTHASLLRELATAFMSVDRLTIAEDLIRRALSAEAAVSAKRTANPHTRKLLADVLAGQNLAAKAVDEYKAVLLDEAADKPTKLSVADKCLALLTSLGRDDELAAVKNIIQSLEQAEPDQALLAEQ